MALKIREPKGHRPVYLAEFDHLHLLGLDCCSISVLIADLDECTGMFVCSYTKTGLLQNFIILNKSLFDSQKQECREQLKITGVHEFCHFIAIIYAATTVTTDRLKESILERLNSRIDKLPKDTLIKIYNLLSNKAPPEGQFFEELTDRHFRLDIEGDTPDYNVLFYHFMFSKDLFETDFTAEKQLEFKQLIESRDKQDANKAIELLVNSIRNVSREKSVPYGLAFGQILEWVHKYV
jgi:hypothetical protein